MQFFSFLFSIFLLNTLYGADIDQVWNRLISNPYRELPQYKVSYSKLFNNQINLIFNDANRTLYSYKDLLPPFNKLAHPNGICFRGRWNITQANEFSGYFQKGTSAPIIIRISSAMSNTKSGENRSFGLAGKIFSNQNPNIPSANFFLIDDLGGTNKPFFSDTTLTNEPELSFSFTILNNFLYSFEVTKIFSSVDSHPTIRQLYEISSLEASNKIITPKYLQLHLETLTNHKTNDFRKELQIKNGKNLIFNILVSNDKHNWQKIGNITLVKSICSLSCDKELHFHHPKFKEDLNYK